MENILVKKMKKRFDLYFEVLEDTVSRCPDELWNKRCSGYIFWHQLLHTFAGTYLWLRDEKVNFFDAINKGINGFSIYSELDVEPKDAIKEIYTKSDILKIRDGAKEQYKNGLRIKMTIGYIYKCKWMTDLPILMLR